MTYIFVDVDGVLNPDNLRPGGFTILAKPYGPGSAGYKLKLHKDYAKWLLELQSCTGARLVWGTTWQQWANEWVGVPLGLPEMPYLDLSPQKYGENLGSIKGRQAVAYANGSPFVYFDDEPNIGYAINGSKGLHIAIDWHRGLEESHIEVAKEYLKSVNE